MAVRFGRQVSVTITGAPTRVTRVTSTTAPGSDKVEDEQTTTSEAFVVEAPTEGVKFENLRIRFSVNHTKASDPSTAEISIWGLSASERNYIQNEGSKVILRAGYRQADANLFVGDIRRAWVERDPPEIVTKIRAGDGERAYLDSRVNVSLGQGSTLLNALNEVAATMGLQVLMAPHSANLAVPYLAGITMSGPSARYLDELVSQVDGMFWTIQDDVLQIMRAGTINTTVDVLHITPDVVIGGVRPDVKTKKGNERIVGVVFRMFLDPTLRPGRFVFIDTEEYSGGYVVESVRSSGDSGFEDQYYSNVRCREPKVYAEEATETEDAAVSTKGVAGA